MSITNSFGNWQNMINEKIKEPTTGYSQGSFIDSSVVISSSYAAARSFRYWMQSLDGGCLSYIQPEWLVAL
jgi:hypothetical protein